MGDRNRGGGCKNTSQIRVVNAKMEKDQVLTITGWGKLFYKNTKLTKVEESW